MNLEEIYREHFRFVWRTLWQLGVCESDVPDAVQDVFVVVHRQIAAFEGRSRLTTWLYGICVNVASSRRRAANARREVVTDAAVASEIVDEAVNVAMATERREGIALLQRILEDMPMEQRTVFTLFELEELSGDAIAELLNIPRGTVHSRLRLARAAFHAAVGRLNERERFALGNRAHARAAEGEGS